jgi:hypothetical protein
MNLAQKFLVQGCWSRAAAIAWVLVQCGCGGVSHEETKAPATPLAAPRNTDAATRLVRIVAVKNVTKRPEVEQLCHYVHLKMAELIEASGRFAVVSDELLEASDLPFALRDKAPAAANCEIEVEITQAEEQAGATVSLGIFSSQQQNATAAVRVRWREIDRGGERTAVGRGQNRKGAWGVVAKVNRDSLLSRKGFWEFDQSMMGGAAAEALRAATETFLGPITGPETSNASNK